MTGMPIVGGSSSSVTHTSSYTLANAALGDFNGGRGFNAGSPSLIGGATLNTGYQQDVCTFSNPLGFDEGEHSVSGVQGKGNIQGNNNATEGSTVINGDVHVNVGNDQSTKIADNSDNRKSGGLPTPGQLLGELFGGGGGKGGPGGGLFSMFS